MALARSAEDLPRNVGTGSWAFELKFDGWRLVACCTTAGVVELWSRHGTDLTGRFPEIAAAASELPAGTVVDGEVCVYRQGRLDWDQLQLRTGSPARLAEQVRPAPASYVVFDVLAVGGSDLRPLPWSERRAVLEGLAGVRPPLQVCPFTRDRDEAASWMQEYRDVGIEGVVAKSTTAPYRPGERAWVKVKHRETTEVVVGAVTGSLERPESVIAGRYTSDGQLMILGRSTALSEHQAVGLAASLTPVPAAQHPWPAEIGSQFGGASVRLVHIAPILVAEVSADTARQSGRFRLIRIMPLEQDLIEATTGLARDSLGVVSVGDGQ